MVGAAENIRPTDLVLGTRAERIGVVAADLRTGVVRIIAVGGGCNARRRSLRPKRAIIVKVQSLLDRAGYRPIVHADPAATVLHAAARILAAVAAAHDEHLDA